MIKLIDILSEIIDPSEAYNDTDAINTIVQGKRKIAFIVEKANNADNWERIQQTIKDNNLKIVYVKGNPNHAYIVYTPDNVKNAMELKKLAEKYDGYLSANATKEDTRRIGELLEYTPKAIDAFVTKNFPNEPVEEISMKKAAAIGAMGLATLGSPKSASGQNFKGLKDKFKAGITAVKDKIKPQQKIDTVRIQKDAPLVLAQYKDDPEVGYGTAKSKDQRGAMEMARFNAKSDLMKKLGKTNGRYTITGLSEKDSKLYQNPDGSYIAEVTVHIIN
jgi:hypothetical protein